jgi:hypothetical protein
MTVIAVLVLTFTARAALRLTGLDPLGFILGNGENGRLDGLPAAIPQGFGGIDVPIDAAKAAERSWPAPHAVAIDGSRADRAESPASDVVLKLERPEDRGRLPGRS